MPDRRRRAAMLAPSACTRSHDPREAVLDALVRVVARRGYEHTTTAEVLALARVPEPVFAEHFEGMRDCLLATLDRSIARLGAVIERSVEESAPWPEQIGAGLRALLSGLAERPEEARLIFVECLAAGEPAIVRLRRALAGAVPALELGRSGDADAGSGTDAREPVTGPADRPRAEPDRPLGKSGRLPGRPQAEPSSVRDTGHLPPLASEALAGGIASILHRRVLAGEVAELPALLPDLLYFALMPYLGHERALAHSRAAARSAARRRSHARAD